jgi:hydroxyacylglutathione hydrolase
MIEVHQFPCLSDNYGLLVHEPASGRTATIDTPDAAAILAEAEKQGWRLTDIWNTHWHPDHAGGNAEIVAKTGARVTGPEEVTRIAARPDHVVTEGDIVALGNAKARVLDVGGHTLGHIAYVFDEAKIAFVGDALFSMGCGRLFEGTPEQMWSSLSKIAALPRDFTLYCAHEYTEANGRFAIYYDPINQDLQARIAEVKRLRAENKPTVPMRLDQELKTNPFLRAPLLKQSLMMPGASDVEVFAELRKRKDSFN